MAGSFGFVDGVLRFMAQVPSGHVREVTPALSEYAGSAMSGSNSWPSRSGGPSAQPRHERCRNREPHGSCAISFRTNEIGEAHRRPSDHDGAHADARRRSDRSREDPTRLGSHDHTEFCARSSSLPQWRVGDDRDRRPDARRARVDAGHREQRYDAMRACSPRPSSRWCDSTSAFERRRGE